MNVIVCKKPEAQSKIAEREAKPAISAEERTRRQAAVNYSRGSVRLEGFILSPFAEELNQRYVNGEITRKEKTALLLARYNS